MIKTTPLRNWSMPFNSDHGGDALPSVNPAKIKATEKHIKESLALMCVDYAVQGKEPQ